MQKPAHERETNRWLLMFYDTIVYVLCWLLMFVAQPSVNKAFSFETRALHFCLGYALFFGLRFAFRVYLQIWRNAASHAFAREFVSDLCASALYAGIGALISRLFRQIGAPFTTLAAFAGIYTALSLLMRLIYSRLYRAAKKDTRRGKLLKQLLRHAGLVDFGSKAPGATLHMVLEPAQHSTEPINEIQRVVDQFAIRGSVTAIKQIKKGYINRTYRVETLSDRGHVHTYTLQRINTNVFKDVEALMANFKYTTDHLHGRMILPGSDTKAGSVQMLRPTKDGRSYLSDVSGCWRMLTHFDNVHSLDLPDSPGTFYSAGRAFGKFVKEMADVNAADIYTVIPNFHNTLSRYEDLEKAVAADPAGRVKDVGREIAFVRERAANFGLISSALESGAIPTRVCHNDCNLNNILFDDKTNEPVAIIDLDTVMPSSPLYDFGDSMRIGTNTANDDEKDLSKVSCSLPLYAAYAKGYLEECGRMLTGAELELLPFAALIITSEDGIRFLMDHINGDTYYNIYYPGQNLDRARTQLKLLGDMESKLGDIVEILNGIYALFGLGTTLDANSVLARWKTPQNKD